MASSLAPNTSTAPDDATGGAAQATPKASAVKRRTGRWRLRNWRLRSKLLAVMLIPTAAALLLGGLRVQSDLGSADYLAKLSKQVQLETSVANVVHQLQRERDLTVRYVAANRTGDLRVLDAQRKRVVDAVDALQTQIGQLAPSLDPAVANQYRNAADQMKRLDSLRLTVANSSYPASGVLRAYSDSVNSIIDVADQAIGTITNTELARLQQTASAVARMKEQMSLKRAILLDVFQTHVFDTAHQRALLAADAQLNAARTDFNKTATPEERRFYDDTVVGKIVDNANFMEEAALTRVASGQSIDDLSPDSWDNAATFTVNAMRTVQTAMLDKLSTSTSAFAAQAQTNAIVDSSVVLGALLLALAMALFVANSLLKPLRVLRRTALDVAGEKLPEAVERILAAPNPTTAAETAIAPVPVHTREEVGQVARAFDAVHGEAVRLAAQQALLRDNVNAMFVNLSRRSQTLVERQLTLIDQLEQDEQDPDQLANLFELDHLATRMRRNSENLLVLSGTDVTRRLVRPVPAGEMIGAAVSEVEQYARVQVAPPPDLAVRGRVVNDLVHLIAELLDNATAFSDPQTKVNVRTARSRRGELAIEIQDRGVGMGEQEIVSANERLAEPPDVDVAVSRRMGLFVVARLAKRHDIKVRLRSNQDIDGGTTATVIVPVDLLQPLAPGGPVAAFLPSEPAPESQLPAIEQGAAPENRPQNGIAAAFSAEHRNNQHEQQDEQHEQQDQQDLPVRFVPGEGEQDAAQLPSWATGAGAESGDHWLTPAQDLANGDQYTGQCGEPSDVEATYRTLFEPITSVGAEQPAGEFASSNGSSANSIRAGGEEQSAAELEHRQKATVDGALNAKSKKVERDLDAPTERLPIYEAVLSQWFRAVETDSVEEQPIVAEQTAVAEQASVAEQTAVSDSPSVAEQVAASEQPAEVEQTAVFDLPLVSEQPAQTDHSARDTSPTSEPLEQSQHRLEGIEEDRVDPRRSEAMPSAPPLDRETAAPASHQPQTGGLPKRVRQPSAIHSAAQAAAGQPAQQAPIAQPAQQAPAAQPAQRAPVAQPAQPAQRAPVAQPAQRAVAAQPQSRSSAWQSPGDEGWQAADALFNKPPSEGVTPAGLPKRVPKAQLIPGSAAPRSQPQQQQQQQQQRPATPRSADAVRGRMTSLQHGVRRGRHALSEAFAGERSSAEPFSPFESRHDEEQV